ncbi:MAG: DNA polymerase III subunit alpha, partial [Actinomycetota bacterium]
MKSGDVAGAERAAGEYRDIFGAEDYFIELQDHGLAEQRVVTPKLLELAGRLGAPLVATNDLHYTERSDAGAHDVLLCIQTNAKINEAGRFKFDAEEFYLKTAEEMRALFADHPEACDNTLAIAERCDVSVEFGTLHLPPFEPPTEETQEQYLRRLVSEGAAGRYGDPLSPEATERIEHELGIILRMGFAGYFLIVADLIRFARTRGIRVGPGRGSAAGSVVSYCLGITDLDPIRYGLIFERFLNPDRRQMPDIDMDFDERGRGEMIRYATERYGEDRVAQIVTFGTIKGKQAIRDAARVLDLPYGIGDRLAKMYPPPILGKDAPLAACFDRTVDWPDPGVNEAYPQAADLRQSYQEDEISRRVLDNARELEGLRRQVSVHAAGVVIGDAPLVNYTPLQRAQDGAGGIVTQYEMHAVESLGLLKMDFLGLRTLTVLEDAVRNVERTRAERVDIDAVPLDHAGTYEMLSRGDTIAIFQLESPGMRDLVKKLRPDRFEDVMALVALYRPGPLGERMHIEYAMRKHGQRTVEYLHPDLKPILEETFGIILYQEQALRIAVDMAGFSMAEADTLRKAIGKKIGDVMRAQREKFVTGCVAKGYTKELAIKLWEMIDHFSGYGFNKCLVGSTRIPDADTGRVWTIRELFDQKRRISVSSLDADGQRVTKSIGDVWSNGVKPVFRLRTRLGREVVATDNHPLYTFDGWRLLGELRPGDRIAAPRALPAGQKTWPHHQLATLGWVLSEGNTCHPSGFYRSGARRWLGSLGLVDCGAKTKFIPPEVFELCPSDLAVFVGRLWSGDGFVCSAGNTVPFYATSSPRLAGDVQDVLLRLGILSRIAVKSFKYRGTLKPGYAVYLAHPESIERFVSMIGPQLVGRDDQLHQLGAYLSPLSASRSSRDVVPVAGRRLIRSEKARSGLRWTDIEAATGLSTREMSSSGNLAKQGFRRSTVLILADHFGSPELKNWATADIFWDTIVSIEPAGEEETFDLEVPETHNFVAEGLYVHNSHSCGYAYIAFQTAYLKATYPVEYLAALLTSVRDKQDRTALYLAECRTMNITVDPPDVNLSASDYTPLPPAEGKPGEIRIGLSAIRNVGENVVAEIIADREKKGPFTSFADFCHRVDPTALNKRVVESFVKAGAFDSLGLTRADFLTWGTDTRTGEQKLVLSEAAATMLDAAATYRRNEDAGQSSLFSAEEHHALVDPAPSGADIPRAALLTAEKDMLGLYVSDHPLFEVEKALRASTDTSIADIAAMPEG